MFDENDNSVLVVIDDENNILGVARDSDGIKQVIEDQFIDVELDIEIDYGFEEYIVSVELGDDAINYYAKPFTLR